MDAHERGQKLSYSYNETHQQLVIKNDGALLPRETLVLGVTSKKGISSQRGEFGEGYKLAAATLCRLGAKIAIFNGKEAWIPGLEHSEVFNTEVLCFTIRPNTAEYPLTFVINGVPKSEWESARSRLLFLQNPYPEALHCAEGRVLLAPEYAGRLYVKGIYVSDLPDQYAFGYDLAKIKLDRDRQSPDTFTLRQTIATVLKRVVESGAIPPTKILEILEAGGGETLAFDSDWGQASAFHQMISDAFDSKYGSEATPVASLEESVRARDFALKGIIVNAPLLRALRKVKSPLDRILASKVLSTSKVWDAHELSDDEISNLKWAVDLVSKVEPASLAQISVVDFVGDKLWGKFELDKGQVFLARRILKERVKLIATLIHELCHRYGPDGDQSHRDAVEDRMAKLIVLHAGAVGAT
jgi:hypothetical protein